MTSAYDYLHSNSTIVCGGFVEAGSIEALEEQVEDENTDEDEDPFKDLD